MMDLDIGGVELTVDEDVIYGQLIYELLGPYDFDSIPFEPGDVVLDIGAHKGVLAMYLAKRWPELKILSFEPVPVNYEQLLKNLKRNKVTNVKPYQLAVTADGRKFPMIEGGHSAEGSGFFYDGVSPDRIFTAKSTTIKAIIGKHRIKQVKLLKLDCEGAEHEIMADSDSWADKVDYLRGEVHMIPTLVAEGYTVGDTIGRFPAERSAWQVIESPALLT